MVKIPLLATKFYIPPPHPNLVSRPQLIKKLNEGLHRKLTLISAPAGFGKTTLVSELVHALGESAAASAIAWISLDESDNDLTRFLTYFISALQTIQTDFGKGALSALQSPQPPPAEGILTALINEIATISPRIILVLDDYHLIETQPIHNALAFLLRRIPPSLHLVITTRVDPPLPLARLRARDQLTEIRATDLRFSFAEAAEFLNQVMGLELTAVDITALETRTEGWIAGLQLAAISMQGSKDVDGFVQAFTGSHHFILDYLVEEVLEQQSPSLQNFLLQTAVLDRLTSSLCDTLTGQNASSDEFSASSQEILETLERTNLFIVPLDNERRWYRYHHLFADLLRQRLRQVRPGWVPVLYQRAIDWFEKNGFIDEAIEHALHAKDFERAANLIEVNVDVIWQRGEYIKSQRWLSRLPTELLFSKRHLCILHAWNLFANGQLDATEKSLQAAEKTSGSSADHATETSPIERDKHPDSESIKIKGRAAAIRAFLAFYRGDVQAIQKYANQALELLPEQDLTWRSTATVALGDAYSFVGDMPTAFQVRMEAVEASKAAGNVYMTLIASLKLVVTVRQQGRLDKVIEICQQQMQLASNNGQLHTSAVGWLMAIWGETLVEMNDLEGALERAKTGTELTEGGGDMAMLGWSYMCLTRVFFSRGDLVGAAGVIQKMENITRESYLPPWLTSLIDTWQARIWLAQDNLDAASQWVGERELDADNKLTYLNEREYMVLARILTAQMRFDEALALLQRLLEATDKGGRTSRVIQILLLQALTFQAGDDTDKAIAVLERALTLAESRGYFRIFIDEGPSMAHLLYEALTRGIVPEYVQRLLAAFPVTESEQVTPLKTQVPASDLIEPLSERELEVLELFAQGLTNSEIACKLYLSPHTVKTHSSNIYSKLGVHRRTQAVARARALGLLSST